MMSIGVFVGGPPANTHTASTDGVHGQLGGEVAEGGESAGAHGHPLAESACAGVGTSATVMCDVAVHADDNRDL